MFYHQCPILRQTFGVSPILRQKPCYESQFWPNCSYWKIHIFSLENPHLTHCPLKSKCLLIHSNEPNEIPISINHDTPSLYPPNVHISLRQVITQSQSASASQPAAALLGQTCQGPSWARLSDRINGPGFRGGFLPKRYAGEVFPGWHQVDDVYDVSAI